jgi:peptide-methionine (S)-S-oxide reductase
MTSRIFFIFLFTVTLTLEITAKPMNTQNNDTNKQDTATFGTGCFWCSEAIFSMVDGVLSVTPGYSGGQEPNPGYELVCSGTTDYAEVIQVVYDPEVISYKELLEIFWKTHDPTTLNRQGADVGKQYRSVIFYHNKEQKNEAEYYKDQLEKSKIWKNKIVTEISRFEKFYPAEDYHKDYYRNNPANTYCHFVITPKVEKFKKIFSGKLAK